MRGDTKTKISQEFRSLFENIIDGVVVADHKTKKFYRANKMFCKMLGYRMDEITSLEVKDVHTKEDLPHVLKQFKRQVAGEITLARDIPVKRKDGSIFYADVNSAPIMLEGREYLMGIFRDITYRRSIEEALKKSEQRFRSMIEMTSDWVWEVSSKGTYTYVSPKVKDLLGYKPEEVLGKTPFDLMPEDEAKRVAALFDDIIKNRKPFVCLENTNMTKKGKKVVLETSGVPIFDEEGELAGYRGIDRDITHNKRIEEALRESETRYRAIFENTGTATMIIEADLGIYMVNAEMEKLTGYPKSELEKKKNAIDFIEKKHKDKVREYHRLRIIDPRSVPRNYELQITDKKENIKDAYLTVDIIPGSTRSVVSIQDITELKRKEQELSKQKEILDRTNKALEHKLKELNEAMGHIKKLEGLVPICAHCKRMLVEGKNPRESSSWVSLEKYITERTNASFTHGLCPHCMKKAYGEMDKGKKK